MSRREENRFSDIGEEEVYITWKLLGENPTQEELDEMREFLEDPEQVEILVDV